MISRAIRTFAGTKSRRKGEAEGEEIEGRQKSRETPEEGEEKKKWLASRVACLHCWRARMYLTRVLTRIVRRGLACSIWVTLIPPKAFPKSFRALHCGVFTATAARDPVADQDIATYFAPVVRKLPAPTERG